MISPPLFIPFALATLSHFLFPVFFPALRFTSFAPFLVLVFMRKSIATSLWVAALVGLLADLSSSLSFGIFSLSYTLASLVCYKWRTFFYEEGSFSLALYTLLFSLIFSPLSFFLTRLFGHPIPLSFLSFLSNFNFMAILDALYAFFWFSCPLMVYTFFRRIRRI